MTQEGNEAQVEWDRQTLNDELFRRPPVRVGESSLVIHTAVLQDPDEAAESIARLSRLLAHHNLANPDGEGNYGFIAIGDDRLKWERHTEFTSYTLITRGSPDDPLAVPDDHPLGIAWMSELSGTTMAATRLRVVPQGAGDILERALVTLRPDPASGLVAEGQARLWADCSIASDGYTRLVVEDRGVPPDRRGRLIQRLIELETYRMMALLGFPHAKAVMGQLQQLEAQLQRLVARVANSRESEELDNDEATLDELLVLASEIEHLSAMNAYRFDASQAYFDIVEQRLEDLREERVQGHQRLSNFLRRRVGPAIQTVKAVSGRLETLSGHINFTASLIRTRVDLGLQRQNRTLLHSMDRRSALQLRLQQTLEWFTVAAMSYYGIGVIKFIAEGAAVAGASVPPALVAGIAAPLVIVGAYWLVHRIRRILREDEATDRQR